MTKPDRSPAPQPVATTLPAEGYVRLSDIVGDAKSNPPRRGVLPIGRSTFWAGIRQGKYPPPVKLGARTAVWDVSTVRRMLETISNVSEI